MSCVKMEAKYSLKVLAMSMLFSAYDLLFPFPSFNCLDTFPGMCETFDFNLKNDQNRFGLCLREVQIELMYSLRLSHRSNYKTRWRTTSAICLSIFQKLSMVQYI